MRFLFCHVCYRANVRLTGCHCDPSRYYEDWLVNVSNGDITPTASRTVSRTATSTTACTSTVGSGTAHVAIRQLGNPYPDRQAARPHRHGVDTAGRGGCAADGKRPAEAVAEALRLPPHPRPDLSRDPLQLPAEKLLRPEARHRDVRLSARVEKAAEIFPEQSKDMDVVRT
jgi:hypothetical protein